MGVIRNVPLKKDAELNKEVFLPTTKPFILYQGVLNPGRGIKPMIQALHFIEGLDLVIIGYGKVEKALKSFVEEENLLKRVHFLGRIPKEDLINYTKKATLGMVLEEPLGKSFEFSLPNKLFDYIHAALPIISGNLPEISKIIKDFSVGVIVKDYKPETIAETIKVLLADKERIKTLKENQIKAKEILCWEKEKSKLDTYFN
jgi:glycosyltransferase involved in cell wall biosynthesis